ncbi:unnamed protein product [Parnassius apollo]|uniref:(apollo) hypothetical protein n=1 Tax=Parnassius apollo TaxID=110799 RepID=A0A8S3X0G7_PARAO|nr:unnamed protein product [Parnassius apollo]
MLFCNNGVLPTLSHAYVRRSQENAKLSHGLCAECLRRAGRARPTFARDLEPCPERVMETISEDAEAELELGKYAYFKNLTYISDRTKIKIMSDLSSVLDLDI